MTIEPINFSLLADQSRFQHLGDRFRSTGAASESSQIWTLVWLALAIAVVAAVLTFLVRFAEKRRYRSALRLYLELCRAHNLKWTNRWLLWRLACYRRLAQPARLFIEPEQFTSGPLSPGLAARQARLSEIYNSIFAAPAVEATDSEETDGDAPDGPERDDRPEQQHASADAATPEPDPVPA